MACTQPLPLLNRHDHASAGERDAAEPPGEQRARRGLEAAGRVGSKSSHSSREASPPSTPVQVHPHPLEAEGSADYVSVGVLSVLHRHTQQPWCVADGPCSYGCQAAPAAHVNVYALETGQKAELLLGEIS